MESLTAHHALVLLTGPCWILGLPLLSSLRGRRVSRLVALANVLAAGQQEPVAASGVHTRHIITKNTSVMMHWDYNWGHRRWKQGNIDS